LKYINPNLWDSGRRSTELRKFLPVSYTFNGFNSGIPPPSLTHRKGDVAAVHRQLIHMC